MASELSSSDVALLLSSSVVTSDGREEEYGQDLEGVESGSEKKSESCSSVLMLVGIIKHHRGCIKERSDIG